MKGESKKIGNSSFNVGAVKKMGLARFKETYKVILKNQDLEAVYYEITGGKPASKGKDKEE